MNENLLDDSARKKLSKSTHLDRNKGVLWELIESNESAIKNELIQRESSAVAKDKQ